MRPSSLRALAVARGVAPMVRGPIRVGYVHSVFRRAANLWVPDTLLAITAPTAPRVPNGLVVDDAVALPDGAFLGLDAGMAVRVGIGFVRVPAAGLCIDLADVPMWDPRPQFPARPIAPAVLTQHLDRLTILARDGARAKPWSLASILDPLADEHPGAATLDPREAAQRERLASRARSAAGELLSGIAAGDSELISAAAGQLAGLGHGLTPSGDDFLTGICGALALVDATSLQRRAALVSSRRRRHLGVTGNAATSSRESSLTLGMTHFWHAAVGSAGCGQPEDCENQARAIAAAAAGRTTLLSAIWIDYAAQGEFSAEVGALLVALAEPDAPGLEAAAARLLAVGELSGLDTAVGVLLGSRAVVSSCQER